MALTEKQIEQRLQYIAEANGNKPINDLDDVARAIINVIELEGVKVVGFKWDLHYSDKVSNTHHAPMIGKTNWGGHDKTAPRNYPGFYGRVWIRYAKEPTRFGSEMFARTLSYPGTGGGGAYDGPWETISHAYWKAPESLKRQHTRPAIFSWDYTLFLDDWSVTKQAIEQAIIMARLQSKELPKMNHRFHWEDPDTVAKDKEFLNKFYGDVKALS